MNVKGNRKIMKPRPSIAQEITRCRELLQISQTRMAQLMNLKTHRLSDLEKARSIPSDSEDVRLRRQLLQIMHEARWMVRSCPSLGNDPRLRALRNVSLAS